MYRRGSPLLLLDTSVLRRDLSSSRTNSYMNLESPARDLWLIVVQRLCNRDGRESQRSTPSVAVIL